MQMFSLLVSMKEGLKCIADKIICILRILLSNLHSFFVELFYKNARLKNVPKAEESQITFILDTVQNHGN